MKKAASQCFLVGKGLSIERCRRGGRGHRILGDTAGSWSQNRRFRKRKAGGAAVEGLGSAFNILPSRIRLRQGDDPFWDTFFQGLCLTRAGDTAVPSRS